MVGHFKTFHLFVEKVNKMNTNIIETSRQVKLFDFGTLRLLGFQNWDRVVVSADLGLEHPLRQEVTPAINKAFGCNCVELITVEGRRERIFTAKCAVSWSDGAGWHLKNPRRMLKALRHKLVAVLRELDAAHRVKTRKAGAAFLG